MLDVEYPAQPGGVPWPTAAWPTGPAAGRGRSAAVQAIVDEAFRSGDADGGTVDALLAVSGGQLVLEAYNGWDPAAPHMSWSMAKSVTHALLGLLVAEGRIDPFAPAPVPEWADPADPRHAITVDQLLRMRSGLDWQEEYAGTSDVITMLYGDGRADRGHYAAAKPLLVEPDTTFSYSTGTSMILARIIADQVGYGDAGTAWAQAALFDPLGITTVAHDLDGIGTMSGGSNINMSAQDFARFGLLYLRGGEWDGRQLLPRVVGRRRAPAPGRRPRVRRPLVGRRRRRPPAGVVPGRRLRRPADHRRAVARPRRGGAGRTPRTADPTPPRRRSSKPSTRRRAEVGSGRTRTPVAAPDARSAGGPGTQAGARRTERIGCSWTARDRRRGRASRRGGRRCRPS